MRLLERIRGRDARAAPAWLVVGLGNPGPRYAGTRHNIGRAAVEELARRHGVDVGTQRFNARFGLGQVADTRLCLAQPLTYMNLSGQAVAPLARFYQVPPEKVLVVFDDLDLPLGKVRLRSGGGSGGHNGLTSVLASLGTREVPRVRLGIGRPPPGWDAADFVLARFTAQEQAEAANLAEVGADAVEAVVRNGLESAMNAFNR